MRVLVIGNGARENALCWRLKNSPSVTELFCAPGSPGTLRYAITVLCAADDLSALVAFAKEQQIALTVVGPELPLSLGVVDRFRAEGLTIFGPTAAAAQIESSKGFAKEIMNRAGVPTARHTVLLERPLSTEEFLSRHPVPVVLKADGLAGGKGVFVCNSAAEVQHALDALYHHSNTGAVVVEEFLDGTEVSFIVATDGETVIPLPLAHDYKRIFDQDQGPNTGGMGTVCPSPRFPLAQSNALIESVITPVLQVMRERGSPFSGFLYAGLMITPGGEWKVLEFNARLGDPETQSIMPMLTGDLAQALFWLATPKEKRSGECPNLGITAGSAVTVVLAAAGYPGEVRSNDEITGVELAESLNGVTVFHAGTKRGERGSLFTAGGRVLSVTARAGSLNEARALAYKGADMIQFKGRQIRRDIGVW